MAKGIVLLIEWLIAIAIIFGFEANVCAQPLKNLAGDKFNQSSMSLIDPRPTPEQIENGRALLAKLALVLETIALMDADAIMAEFGVKELDYEVYPTHIRVTPKEQSDLLRQGLIRLSVRPWERLQLPNLSAFVGESACIQKKDIDTFFGLPYRENPVVVIDRVLPNRDFYPTHFSYLFEKAPFLNGGVEVDFIFYSKFCVESFGAGYTTKRGKIK